MKGKLLFLVFIITSSLNFSQVLYWQEIGAFRFIRDLEVINDSVLFLCNQENGVFRSTNCGESWKVINSNHHFEELAYDSVNEMLYGFISGSVFYRSSDLGETWVTKSPGIWYHELSKVNSVGDIVVSSFEGDFAYSSNFGNSWSTFNLNEGFCKDIEFDSMDNLYVAYAGGIAKTSDWGNNWSLIYSEYPASSIAIDDNDNLYIVGYNQVLYSTNYGLNWNNLEYTELDPEIIEIDEEQNIYVADGFYRGLFKKSSDTSWNYIGLKRIEMIKIINAGKIFAISYDSFGGERVYFYDSSSTPYIGENYLPLNEENKWEQFYSYSSISGPSNAYDVNYITVDSDTLIDSKKYYKISEYPTEWLRYDDTSNIVYVNHNLEDHVKFDFNRLTGEKYLTYSVYNSELYEVEAINSNQDLFGQSVNCRGYIFSDYFNTIKILFAENFGFIKKIVASGGIGSSGTGSYNTIQAIIKGDDGDSVFYNHTHYPSFIISPILTISEYNFDLTFFVDHYYTRTNYSTYFGDLGVNYIDDVKMEYFYSKKGQVTEPNYLSAVHTPYTLEYNVYLDLDSTLLNAGYELKYRLTATEIGILPKSTTVPDTGWYTCRYDNTVSVEDETNNLAHQFSLAQNFPNPFNPTTTIKYVIAEDTFVNISVFDVLGKKVAVLVNENKLAGNYEVKFDAEKYNSGIYFYQIDSGKFKEVKKMMLLK